MDQIAWFILQVLDSLTFGWFSGRDPRHGQLPDPEEVWDEERLRLGSQRIEREALGGRTGIALTQLRPVGTVELDGRRHEAASEEGLIEAGTTIEVVGSNNFVLIVREKR
jgi:hypothetical protein